MITTNFYHHFKHFGLILLCGILVLSATACRSDAPASSSTPRALWVWDAGVASNLNDQKTFLDFCNDHSIRTIFLDLGDFDHEKKLPEDNRKHLTAQRLGDFLEAAHAANIKVEGLGGDPHFALTERHQFALDQMKRCWIITGKHQQSAASTDFSGTWNLTRSLNLKRIMTAFWNNI